jgi:hypothetical protein
MPPSHIKYGKNWPEKQIINFKWPKKNNNISQCVN